MLTLSFQMFPFDPPENSCVFIVKFEPISRLFLVFLLLLWTSKY